MDLLNCRSGSSDRGCEPHLQHTRQMVALAAEELTPAAKELRVMCDTEAVERQLLTLTMHVCDYLAVRGQGML